MAATISPTRAYRLTRPAVTVLCLVQMVIGLALVAFAVWLVNREGTPGISDTRNSVGAVISVLVAVEFFYVAIRGIGMRVLVGPDGVIAHNLLRTKRAPRGEIEALNLASRVYGYAKPDNGTLVPWIALRDGGGFWLDAAAGARVTKPPRPEQVAAVHEMRLVLGVGGVDEWRSP
ncbi:MAG TPA: hypothetical protein VK277_05100 [Acidimicrobiales bacterium]|nr:hypothetical protein [Acidimicrobiales bacterium]